MEEEKQKEKKKKKRERIPDMQTRSVRLEAADFEIRLNAGKPSI